MKVPRMSFQADSEGFSRVIRLLLIPLSLLLLDASSVRAEDSDDNPEPEYCTPIPVNADSPSVPLDWWNVLVLVNADSPASVEVAKMYREYHPRIACRQVLYLSGLPDSASLSSNAADEIITREQYETLIAQPTRAHLLSTGLVDRVQIIITTAGMPYRIEDTDPELADVVKPAASDAFLTVTNRHRVDAATVEAELSLLFQQDPALGDGVRAPIQGRIVNPFQGYRCGIKRWSEDRDILTRRDTFRWTYMWRVSSSPKIEGLFDWSGYSALDRRMSPADIYLVARLDGPRGGAEYPVFAVRDMLERAAMAGKPNHPRFVGYNPALSVVAIDHSPRPPAPDTFAYTQTFNVPPQYMFLNSEDHTIPPGGEAYNGHFNSDNHYFRAHLWLTGIDPIEGATTLTPMSAGLGGTALWDDSPTILSAAHLDPSEGIIGLLTYGRNGGDGRPRNYLVTAGPGNGPLFKCVPGAVFASLESFNTVTMFTHYVTIQGKIAEFIAMGGTAAIGHAFEPEVTATIQGDFMLRNLLRDENGDGKGDLTVIEAAYTGLPYLSWSEVFIGDPLMRLHAGPGGLVDLSERPGDVDQDGYVGYDDALEVLAAFGNVLGQPNYFVPADQTRDGVVDGDDLNVVLDNYGATYPSP